jgi:hypothetical protein
MPIRPVNRLWTASLLCWLLLAGALVADDAGTRLRQRPPEPPHREHRRGERGGDPNYIRQWMERLQATDPGEYQRLQALRANQPMAFRAELRQRLHTARIRHRIKMQDPEFLRHLETLPPDQRQRFERFLGEWGGETPARPVRRRHRPGIAVESETGVQQWLETWRQAGTDEERAAAREGLRTELGALLERQRRQQEDDLREAEAALQRLKQMMERSDERSAVWIERWINLLLPAPPDEAAN